VEPIKEPKQSQDLSKLLNKNEPLLDSDSSDSSYRPGKPATSGSDSGSWASVSDDPEVNVPVTE